MKARKLKLFLLGSILFLSIFSLIPAANAWSFHRRGLFGPQIPSENEIFGWVEDIYEIGTEGQYGYRMPGMPVDWEGAEYVLDKFDEFGLENTFLESVPAEMHLPDEWSLTIHANGDDYEIPSYFLRYAAFTSQEGITKDIVYVGSGSEEEFDEIDSTVGVEDKIVLVDVEASPWPYTGYLEHYTLFEYDPYDTMEGEMATENWPLGNLESSYQLAGEYDAAGYVGILTMMPDHVKQYLHWYADGSLPGLTISPEDGEDLRALVSSNSVEATMVLTGTEGEGTTYNVYGSLPGKSKDTILILSHHDGWATNEASGTSVVMALAKYFSQIPEWKREKTLLFVGFGSHFGKKAAWDEYDCYAYEQLPNVVTAINIEMIGKQIKVIDGEFVETGLVAPRGMFLSGPGLSANEHLLSHCTDAIVENDMDRTFVLPANLACPGEGNKFHQLGVTTINFIAHNSPQFTQYDTPDTVAKDELVPTTKTFIDIIKELDETPSPLLKWTETIEKRGIKPYPDLKETVWHMTRPPYGPCDRIGLHRVVDETMESKGVVFILPGTWSNGEQLASNPPDDDWTEDESHTHTYYLANRGYEVYALDYRTHFVNPYLPEDQLSFMANWGWDHWISDIKEAVELAKEVSGVKKIYLAGESFGGSAAMNYASMYWEEDLKGIILRDGGTGAKYPHLVDNEYNLPEKIDQMKEVGNWSREVGSPGALFVMQHADQNPTAPAEYPPGTPLDPPINPLTGLPWTNIMEWAAFVIYIAWGPGGVSNIYGGYGDPRVMVHIYSDFDRWWPARLGLESAAIADWDNCPYVSYDFDDHYSEIDVPMLAFTSGIFGNASWGPFIHWIENPDFTGELLENYGHLDVYAGEYSEEDVSEPTVEWLDSHKMLEGRALSRCRRRSSWIDATIFINDEFIDFKVGNKRYKFDILAHYYYRRYEIYKGLSEYKFIRIIIVDDKFAMACTSKYTFMGYVV